jgi:hypothetical protein
MNLDETGTLHLKGASAGSGKVYFYAAGTAKGLIDVTASSFNFNGNASAQINFQSNGNFDVDFFASAAAGETPSVDITGYRTGDASRTLEISISPDHNNEALFDGVNTYKFDGGGVFGNYTADPCSGLREGAIWYNDTTNVMCYCNGSDDLKVSDDSACF